MAKGTIKFFNEINGYGFIEPETKGTKDIFFHFSAMKDGKKVEKFDKGKQVSYETKEGKNGLEADQVEITGPAKKTEKPERKEGKRERK